MNQTVASRLAYWGKVAVVPLLAVVIGVGIAIASSPASVTRGQHVLTTPSPIASPSTSPTLSASPPTVTTPGILGAKPRIEASGSASIVGFAQNASAATADGG